MNCCVCKRELTNPLSVKLEIGPVCRARDNLQEVFMFMRAQFTVLKQTDEYIYIKDVGENCRSVTNDAEYVIQQLFSGYGISEKTRVFYDDSCGETDELLHSGGKFTGFKAGHEGVEL